MHPFHDKASFMTNLNGWTVRQDTLQSACQRRRGATNQSNAALFALELQRLRIVRRGNEEEVSHQTVKMEAHMPASAQRVLLVDDNVDSTEPLSLLLQAKGHDTRVAVEGEGAISVADDFQPNCVVLDLGLPGMDGYEVARRLRERPYGGAMVLVALTGWAGKEVRAKAAEAGFDYHLVKPVNWEELERIVTAADAQSRIR
jgi:two-component system OmpR family response regulator